MEGVYPLTGDFKNHFKVKTSKTKPVGTEIHQQLSNIAFNTSCKSWSLSLDMAEKNLDLLAHYTVNSKCWVNTELINLMLKLLVEILWRKQSFRRTDQLLLRVSSDLKIYGLFSKPYLRINWWTRKDGWKKKKQKELKMK